MPRSLARGDYSLIMAVESSSHANSWYRVLVDRQSKNLSCDCPSWVYRQNGNQVRFCKHTRIAQLLSSIPQTGIPVERARGRAAESNILVQATQQQWPGLGGTWAIEQRASQIDNVPYYFVLVRLTTGNGTTATGTVAFTQRFHQTTESMISGVAGWAGYTIAAEVARAAGYALAGQPPEHFKVPQQRRARAGHGPEIIGLGDILRVGDQVNLGDGYTPKQRGENTLRLFLGEELYSQLERLHFLDVSSALYADEQRVYRLRRDPARQYERRVRVFKRGHYINDYCIMRNQDVPEADHWLTVFLRLISDEAGMLSVVKNHNIFSPNSDDRARETIPAIWQHRAA